MSSLPAPVNRLIPPRIAWGDDSMELPETPLHRMRLTVAPELPVKHGNFDKANEARRSVHAGAMSHDDDGRAA